MIKIQKPISSLEDLVYESEEISSLLNVLEDAGNSDVCHMEDYMPALIAIRKKTERFHDKLEAVYGVINEREWNLYNSNPNLYKEACAV